MRDPIEASADEQQSIALGRRVLKAQAQALLTMAADLDNHFHLAIQLILSCQGRVVCCGVGKSGHVARKIAATLASTGTPAFFVHANEASHGDLGMIGPSDVVIALSKSGETRELADVLSYCKRFGTKLIAITGAPDSALGKAADVLLTLPNVPESAESINAPTTSTTLQMAMGDALAVTLMEGRGFSPTDFQAFHPGGSLGAALRTARDLMHTGAELPLVRPETPMSEALITMTEKRFGCLGVVDVSDCLVGIVTDGDLRRRLDGLLTHTAGEVMNVEPRTLRPGMLAAEALRIMNAGERPVTVAFVVEEQRPIGILHVHDLLRAGIA